MALGKLLACTFCAVAVVSVSGCSKGTGTPFSPTLPSLASPAANPDGTILKATSPTPESPLADTVVKNLRPTLSVLNAAGKYDQIALSYIFQLYEGDTLLRQTDSVTVTSERTSWDVPKDLLKSLKTYRWRARAHMDGQEGPWSDFVTFRTPEPPKLDGPVSCPSNTGQAIVACVAAAYPERLVATAAGSGSDARRAANMEFIRDRIIETGKCLGLDLGQNYKRGGPVISHDFIVLRRPGQKDRGVDIASGYDDVDHPLKLTWQEFGADKDYGYPFYRDYGPVDCGGI